MNNKSRIFIAAHSKIFKSFSNSDSYAGQDKSTEISRVFLEISHLYLSSVANADESDYWMSFVFDTCCSSGLCSIRYIEHLSIDQKRHHIQATLSDRLKETSDRTLEIDSCVRRICTLINSQKDQSSSSDARVAEIFYTESFGANQLQRETMGAKYSTKKASNQTAPTTTAAAGAADFLL